MATASMVDTGFNKMDPKDGSYYRKSDGVRITHDPFAAGMVERYGKPGKTDNEGFDPYRDTVGPGIYGGIVTRQLYYSGKEAVGSSVVIGKQYQNHNPRPGPVYAGGGYAPVINAIQQYKAGGSGLETLLRKYPDLANDVTTGGALPLHMCGMSRESQYAAGVLIEHGADLEALDTYGMTPLHRMASNNLPIGARFLLDAGADPRNTGLIGQTPYQIAQEGRATDVMKLLANEQRKVEIDHLEVDFPSIASLNTAGHVFQTLTGKFAKQDAAVIPSSFDKVCQENKWDTRATWNKLNGKASWFAHANGSYIYFNKADGKWWLDGPDGLGVFTAGPKGVVAHAVPSQGWEPIQRNVFDAFGAAVDEAGKRPAKPFMPTPQVRCFRQAKAEL
jgi:hypothetical protein